MSAGRVFISHSKVDHLAAMDICRRVEAHGVRCWIAPRDVLPGEDWASRIAAEIERATGFVVVLSRDSNTSRFVRAETERAFNNGGLPIFPVAIDGVHKSGLNPGLSLFVSSSHIVDAQAADREVALDRMAKDIARTVLGRRGTSSPSGGRARGPLTAGNLARHGLGEDAPYFDQLWAAMEARGSRIAFLPEAFLGGLVWPFYRGLTGLGLFTAIGAVAMTGLGAIMGGSGAAVMMLVASWIGAGVLFALFGAGLLRNAVLDHQKSGEPMPSVQVRVATGLGALALVAVPFVAAAIGMFQPPSPATQSTTIVAGEPGGSPAATGPASANARKVDTELTSRSNRALADYQWEQWQREEELRLQREAEELAKRIEMEQYIRDVAGTGADQQSDAIVDEATAAANDARSAAAAPR